MDNYFSIFRGVLSTEERFFDVYLNCLDEHNIFGVQNKNEECLIQHITALLTSSTTRYLGLRILDKFIDNCSVEAFEKKGNLWTSLVLKPFNNQEIECYSPFIFHVLEISQQSSDLGKSFTSTHLSKIYDCLTNVPISQSKYALCCIEKCMRIYPGQSGYSRAIIEKFLWKNIDRFEKEVVENCGKCLHLLLQIKGGVQGVNHRMQWKNYHLQLLGGIHSVYNKMFANCTEFYEEKIEDEKLPWEAELVDFDPEPIKKAAQLFNRCQNLITYLTIALREPFPVEKPIMIKKILNVIIRGLSVNCSMLEQNPIIDDIALSILLPRLHENLINLLDVAVRILGGHLRPYSELILGLLVDTLKSTSKHGDQKTLISLRKRVYDSLSLWCKIFGSGSRCETIAEYLIQEVLSDITPTKNELTLKVLIGTGKHVSKKVERKHQKTQNEKSNMAKNRFMCKNKKQNAYVKRNQELCIRALRCLQEMILSVGNFIKPTILKMLQINVVKISAMLYELTDNASYLYSNKNCRIEIYNTLYAIVMTTHQFCPPPTEFILAAIQTACARDDNLKVRFRCAFILQNLEKLVHPQKESLLFPIEARDVRNTFIKMGQEDLLPEFGLHYSNSLTTHENDGNNLQSLGMPVSENDDVDDIDISVMESVNCQVNDIEDNEASSGDRSTGNEESNNLQSLGMSFSESGKETENVDSTDISIVESVVNCQVNDAEDNETSTGDTSTRENTKNVPEFPELVHPNKNPDITTMQQETEDVLHKSNIDEPIVKKQKLDNENSEIINVDHDEDQILAEIASQFIDELE